MWQKREPPWYRQLQEPHHPQTCHLLQELELIQKFLPWMVPVLQRLVLVLLQTRLWGLQRQEQEKVPRRDPWMAQVPQTQEPVLLQRLEQEPVIQRRYWFQIQWTVLLQSPLTARELQTTRPMVLEHSQRDPPKVPETELQKDSDWSVHQNLPNSQKRGPVREHQNLRLHQSLLCWVQHQSQCSVLRIHQGPGPVLQTVQQEPDYQTREREHQSHQKLVLRRVPVLDSQKRGRLQIQTAREIQRDWLVVAQTWLLFCCYIDSTIPAVIRSC